MKRSELLAKLKTVSIGLAKHDLVPVMTHFWFTGNSLMTYNDQIAVGVPLKSTFKGAVPGELFLNVMSTSKAKTVDLEPGEEGELLVKAASTRLKLSYIEEDEFNSLFKMPREEADGTTLKLNAELLAKFESCLRSVSDDTSIPDYLGITVIPEKKALTLYTTDSVRLSEAKVQLKKSLGIKERIIIPAKFVNAMLQLCADGTAATLGIYDEYVILRTKANVTLFGRLVNSDEPLDFPGLVSRLATSSVKKGLVKIPTKLKSVIERATIIGGAGGEHAPTKISVKDRKAQFITESSFGRVSDSVLLSDQHGDVSMMVDPRYIKQALTEFDQIVFTKSCCILERKGELYMVAVVG